MIPFVPEVPQTGFWTWSQWSIMFISCLIISLLEWEVLLCLISPSRFEECLFRRRCRCTDYIVMTPFLMSRSYFGWINAANWSFPKRAPFLCRLEFDKVMDLSAEVFEESSEISLDGTVFLFAPAEATGHVLCMLGTMWRAWLCHRYVCLPFSSRPWAPRNRQEHWHWQTIKSCTVQFKKKIITLQIKMNEKQEHTGTVTVL